VAFNAGWTGPDPRIVSKGFLASDVLLRDQVTRLCD